MKLEEDKKIEYILEYWEQVDNPSLFSNPTASIKFHWCLYFFTVETYKSLMVPLIGFLFISDNICSFLISQKLDKIVLVFRCLTIN